MSASGSITPQLREWILATVRAGHGVPEVLKQLKEAGYPPAQGRSAVAQVLKIPLGSINATHAPQGRRTRPPEAPGVLVDGRQVRVSAALEAPIVRVLDGLLDAGECAALIEAARPRLDRALTVAEDGKHQVDERRSSTGMFFILGETPLIRSIEQRLAQLLDLPVEHGEGLQVLHYQPGQEYEPHYDWFDPAQPGFAAVTARGGQRIASVVMYLNTPEAGGATGFPNVGLTVTALAGSAVYFAYEGGDTSSLHAGLPVIRGEKWIATKWLRERPLR
jgi:prolyl 4-hydroxylase